MFKFLLTENFNKNFTANNPEKYAKTKPAITEMTEVMSWEIIIFESLNPFASSKIKDPRITGIEIKKENLTASSLFTPNILAEDIVVPERDIPGRMATAWPIPTKRAISQLIFLGFPLWAINFSSFFLPANSNKISMAAVIIRNIAAGTGFEKADSI